MTRAAALPPLVVDKSVEARPAAAIPFAWVTLPVPLLSRNTSQFSTLCSNGSKTTTVAGVVAVGKGVAVNVGVGDTSGVSVGGAGVAVGPDVGVGGIGVVVGVAVAVGGIGVKVAVAVGVAVAEGVSGMGFGLTINSSAETLNCPPPLKFW